MALRLTVPDAATPALTAERLFDRVAPHYDLANGVLSLGLHARWREAAVRALAPRAGERVLDLCAGTLEMAAELRRASPGVRVIAADRSLGMLARGLAVRPVAPPVQACA